MFTGIIEQTGRVSRAIEDGGNLRLTVAPQQMWTDVELGESVAVNGACLTVTEWTAQDFTVELSRETVAKTAPCYTVGALVNLERAMRLGARVGGHLVSGHVDGTGEIVSIDAQGGAYVIRVRAPRSLAGYLVPKGSITVDGVSLTLVDVGGPAGSRPDLAPHEFTLWLVPHTLQVTSLQHWKAGDSVNLEADQLAKYVERLLAVRELQEVGA
ncbi:riboflavin synthase [Deinococcus peraridilitoris]|uniref:Riboflavin synthase n=1 Tax=Deinococcus peraridilitoris (strain DSM 19664 / LMG 22246 / CIP 109416 / KR-200) TaxID=937777 RepID=L0A1Y8_DEIPD|nr:riboflavin synthase [Deinococcus peraridilitoris]AFZ67861.1 riboflavin synthase, alpha subunit [Deinococcus peraridilitoris DSM 19664]